ncbi:hypothetical protein AJ80_01684 [Polytolypa hystricis UAMH7299]|uniref:BTB domain-containing protein n=1 Tax=Polytolypa hystricis (strain UAMH7299) TaxID=1447883 RepID=A0A2B7YYZ9_POLH7|nr:hypothetical protein AJ80_01684 [Polytolypa hystricis UAMH7299]
MASRKRKSPYSHDETLLGQELLDALASMRSDPKYSDLTILCGHDSYAVHRCVVCTRSDYLAKASDGKFREASTHTITLHEDPALVKQMIEYLYTLDYQATPHIAAPNGCVPDEDMVVEPSEVRRSPNDEETPPLLDISD